MENDGTFHERNFYACPTIRQRPGNFIMVPESMIRRLQACVDSGGGHFVMSFEWIRYNIATVIKSALFGYPDLGFSTLFPQL